MRILIRGVNWVGDAVMTVPALKLLRHLLPDAHLALHTGPWAREVLAGEDFLDQIIPLGDGHASIRGTIREAGLIKTMGFDSAILFPNSFNSALIVRMAGIRRITGFSGNGRDFLLSNQLNVPDWKGSRHEVELYLEIVRGFLRDIGVDPSVPEEICRIGLTVEGASKESAKRMLAELGCGDRFVTLGIGSQNSRAKRWPAEYFTSLADKLSDGLSASIVILGSKADSDIAAEISSKTRCNIIDLVGKTDLADAKAVLSLSDLYIGNDMGLTHLAPAVGTPTLALFGPTNHVATRPFSDIAKVLRREVDCSPCMLRDCPIDHRCMQLLNPEQVYREAESMMERRNERR